MEYGGEESVIRPLVFGRAQLRHVMARDADEKSWRGDVAKLVGSGRFSREVDAMSSAGEGDIDPRIHYHLRVPAQRDGASDQIAERPSGEILLADLNHLHASGLIAGDAREQRLHAAE